MQPYAELLAEEYERRNPGYYIDVQGGGSSSGIQAAVSGAADMGMSSRALRGAELDLWSVMIARDGLALIVHPSNDLDGLSLAEIRGIFDGTITNWRELGGRDARIHVTVREEGSGTRSAFDELVMGDHFVTTRAIVQDSNGAVRQLVSSDRNAIGFLSLGLVDDIVKALSIEGMAPTFENVMTGAYTLYRPFLFVGGESTEPTGKAMRFIEFILSEDGQRLLANEGLIPMR